MPVRVQKDPVQLSLSSTLTQTETPMKLPEQQAKALQQLLVELLLKAATPNESTGEPRSVEGNGDSHGQ
jgi:hypothetical protein